MHFRNGLTVIMASRVFDRTTRWSAIEYRPATDGITAARPRADRRRSQPKTAARSSGWGPGLSGLLKRVRTAPSTSTSMLPLYEPNEDLDRPVRH